ncbi:trigger factor [Conexibacter sp. W3-3-2]|uniref:Trigger factor n=1 Tax=Paraconexibacter algicola TaxID=2133960 RepID=A0A2T4UET7_9ACTN|nr:MULTISPECIES: trigger factor [Solirubrobacterales]MTD42759.1 trigger factor [Conexibacter sp. W3-3-2]PTL56303.1 trigger factor [Paraconexibacter algicola]
MAATKSTPVTATVSELPESRVKIEAEVSAKEVSARVDQAARKLGRDFRLPGFRKGKVPPALVIKQLGREAVLDEAIRDSLSRWYVAALDAGDVVPIGEPQVDLGELPADGEALTFTVEIGVRPTATLGDYKGVEAPKKDPQATDAQIDAEVEQLRQRMARLETVERAAAEGDFVVMDYEGSIDGELFEGGAGRDQMIELGSGQLIPGFEDQLTGASAGDEVSVELTFPEDYQAEHLAGKDAVFAVTVKEVKAKELPELDDEFAENAAGFDSLAELREDLGKKITEAAEGRAENEYREAVLDAVVANATVEVPDALIEARAREMWDRMLHSLSHQGISREMYMQISGQSEEAVLEQAKPDAEQALRRDAVIAAVVAAEGIEPSDGDVLDVLGPSAAQEKMAVEKLRDKLEQQGRLAEIKDDLAQRQALDFLVEHATPVPAPADEPDASADA